MDDALKVIASQANTKRLAWPASMDVTVFIRRNSLFWVTTDAVPGQISTLYTLGQSLKHAVPGDTT